MRCGGRRACNPASGRSGLSESKDEASLTYGHRSETAGAHDAAAGCKLIGRWRIVEADMWDRDYLDHADKKR